VRRALLVIALALFAGGCMSVDATVEASVNADPLSFPQGGTLSGQLVSEARTVPVKFSSPLLKRLSSVTIESMLIKPAKGVNTLDFFRGITLTAVNNGPTPIKLISLGPELLQPEADGSLILPVGVTLDTAFVVQGLSVEADIEFIVPGVDWSLTESFALSLEGGTTLTP
jgi:hypothetical protein